MSDFLLQSAIFGNRSQRIEQLKRDLGIKTKKIKYDAIVQPVKLEQLRREYTALKGARPWSRQSLSMSVEAGKKPQDTNFGLSPYGNTSELGSLRTFVGKTRSQVIGKIHTGVNLSKRLEGANPFTGAHKGKEESSINIQFRLPH